MSYPSQFTRFGLAIILLPLCLIGCESFQPAEEPVVQLNSEANRHSNARLFSAAGVKLFESGFENATTTSQGSGGADITGDGWNTTLEAAPEIGNFSIQYEGGDVTERIAEIVANPVDNDPTGSKKVLMFRLDKPNVDTTPRKSRVQANLYDNLGTGSDRLTKMYQSVRMYLPSSNWNKLQAYPLKIDCLTIFEFWNNKTWGTAISNGFRVSVNIVKDAGSNQPLRFEAHGQTYNPNGYNSTTCSNPGNSSQYCNLWVATSSMTVPLDKWFTVDIYYQQGEASGGRFFLGITQATGQENTVFDVINSTRTPGDLSANGLNDFNPMKMYTSGSLIDYMNDGSNGGPKPLVIYWDDYKIWKDRVPQ